MLRPLYRTNVLRLLLSKGLLDDRLEWLSLSRTLCTSFLKELDCVGAMQCPDYFSSGTLDLLIRWGLVSRENEQSDRISLAFVQSVNLEITYDCEMECRHCLQSGIRPKMAGKTMRSEDAIRILEGAWFSGLLNMGVNITGGETIAPDSSLPDIVEWLKVMRIPFRLNSNGWWGRSQNIVVGDRSFPEAGDLLKWLSHSGMKFLALSFDERFDIYPNLKKSVLQIERICKHLDINCQLITTIIAPEGPRTGYEKLKKNLADLPDISGVIPVDEVDIGGAAGEENSILSVQWLSDRVLATRCRGKGYYRPSTLHISPDGGVRGCMYSPGAADFGNSQDESMVGVINSFDQRPAVQLFQSDRIETYIDKAITPYAEVYRDVLHPCGAAALLGRVVSDTWEAQTEKEQLAAHSNIALDLGLTVNLKKLTS